MPLGRFDPTPQQAITADSFADVDGVTLNGGVHSVVGRNKMTFRGDASGDPGSLKKAKQAASQDDSTTSKARMFPGARNAVLNGANTESIGGSDITITGERENRPAFSTAKGVQSETQPTRMHQGNNNRTSARNRHGSQADSRPTTRRTIEAKVGSKAQNLEVEQGASLSATAGSRVVANDLAEILAIMDKAKEFEELDRDRHAEILTESVGAKIRGEVAAIAGVDVAVRARERGDGGSPRSRKSRNRASGASSPR